MVIAFTFSLDWIEDWCDHSELEFNNGMSHVHVHL